MATQGKHATKNRVGPPPISVAVEFNWECATKIGGGPTRFFDVFFFKYIFFVDISKNGSHGCGIVCKCSNRFLLALVLINQLLEVETSNIKPASMLVSVKRPLLFDQFF